jgi:3-phenylpropionate/cinnamic acid dioxygenase small subunit
VDATELAAREAIRDLVARYNANGDSGRFDAMLALFAEDATLELEAETLHGKPDIRAFFERVAERTGPGRASTFVRHFTATHQIDVLSADEARGRCYYAVLTDRGLDHWGRYLDEYRRHAGRWLFQRRKVTLDAAVPGGWGDRG